MQRVVRCTLVGLLAVAGLTACGGKLMAMTVAPTPLYLAGPPPTIAVQALACVSASDVTIVAAKKGEVNPRESGGVLQEVGLALGKVDAAFNTSFLNDAQQSVFMTVTHDSTVAGANTARAPDAINSKEIATAAADSTTTFSPVTAALNASSTKATRTGTQRAGPRQSTKCSVRIYPSRRRGLTSPGGFLD